jgi:hypothetical protein
MLNGSTPLPTEHAGPVRVIDVQPRASRAGERGETIQRRQVAVHREDRSDHDEPPAKLPAVRIEEPVNRLDVVVREDAKLRARKPTTIDQGGMIERIAVHDVAPSHERGDRPGVGCVPGREE